MTFYISSLAYPFKKSDITWKRDQFLDAYGDVLKNYHLKFITGENTRESFLFDATIEISTLAELTKLSERIHHSILVSGNELVIVDSYLD